MELYTVDIVELYRLRALDSRQYLIEKLNLDEAKATWLLSILKDPEKWKNWFLNFTNDVKLSASLRKELALLVVESCTTLPLGFQQAIQTQMDAVRSEFACVGNLLEFVVGNFYWEDCFQENIRVRGMQERKNYTEYRLLDQLSDKVTLRKRQRSKTEDLNEAESLKRGRESRRVKSTIYGKDSNKEGTSSKKTSSESTIAHSDHLVNHVEKSSSNFISDDKTTSDRYSNDTEDSYQLKASYRRDPFRMAEFIKKTKCFSCCQSSTFSFLKESNQPGSSSLDTERNVATIEEPDDGMSWQPEQFDVFSCVPDVPLIYSKVGMNQCGQLCLDENSSLWNTSSEVMKNCRRLMNVYQMKETFENYSNGNDSDTLDELISSPILSNTELLDSKDEGYVPREGYSLHQVITQEVEAEKYPPQYEWQLVRSFMCSIFMQIGFTHCSQHAMDLMTDMLLEKFQKLGRLLCGMRDYDGSFCKDQEITCPKQVVWYMNNILEEDPLKHLLHCLYRCGFVFRVQDLLYYYSVDLPYLSNTILQVEKEWKKRFEHLKKYSEEPNSYITKVKSNSFCEYDVSESDENSAFGEDGQLVEPFRCFGYIGNNSYLDILKLHSLQGYLQVPPKIIFASQSTNSLE
ncbi:hypothetical protein Gasu2_66500 [Galdieria sulphuraria]|uniref:Uncharacterized protein n=1 Tax=Galdieria sulphuraria TaxID=130081 RepID=M2XAH8_GALSU|nr:uncharacterized protein Gasu_55520 [Galdieria sulphuraria]EME26867.1 hypothetical protein Gasu_55520 [Galdieria sulphuraria]GJD12575.1 hypothetical protein Gasu2_66500 [Galdieria sulphuraria]|eukprot:XP_005703387.1 hypothetical protein Gasu_55520 [Galdieria sulphuraria]